MMFWFLKNLREKLKALLEKFKFFYNGVNSTKHFFLIILDVLNCDTSNYLSKLVINIWFIIYNFFIILLKKLNLFIFESFPFGNTIRRWMFEHYDILLKYSRRNAIIEYTLGKQDISSTKQYSKFQIVSFSLMYIFDNFINFSEQFIERFFVKIRRFFMKLIFKLPDSIYYIFFEAQFNRVKIQKRVALAHLYLLYNYLFYTIVYLADLFFFYVYVFFKNFFIWLCIRWKTLLMYLFIFILFNLLFKNSAFIIYEFFLSFFDFKNCYYFRSYDNLFNNQMYDISNKRLKYNIFFGYEYKKFYASGHFYKIYYIFLTIKYEVFKNLENFWKFFNLVSVLSFFKYHAIFNAVNRKVSRHRYRKGSKKYSWTRKSTVKNRAADDFSRNRKEYEDRTDAAWYRKRRIVRWFKSKYTDVGEKPPFDLREFIWYDFYVDLCNFTKHTAYPAALKFWRKRRFKKKKWYCKSITLFFIFKVLNKIFWVIKKVLYFILSFFRK